MQTTDSRDSSVKVTRECFICTGCSTRVSKFSGLFSTNFTKIGLHSPVSNFLELEFLCPKSVFFFFLNEIAAFLQLHLCPL